MIICIYMVAGDPWALRHESLCGDGPIALKSSAKEPVKGVLGPHTPKGTAHKAVRSGTC